MRQKEREVRRERKRKRKRVEKEKGRKRKKREREKCTLNFLSQAHHTQTCLSKGLQLMSRTESDRQNCMLPGISSIAGKKKTERGIIKNLSKSEEKSQITMKTHAKPPNDAQIHVDVNQLYFNKSTKISWFFFVITW